MNLIVLSLTTINRWKKDLYKNSKALVVVEKRKVKMIKYLVKKQTYLMVTLKIINHPKEEIILEVVFVADHKPELI